MDSLIFELQIVFYFQLFLSANVRHRGSRLHVLVNFEEMSMSCQYSDELSLRRLSGPSYVQEPNNQSSTQWVWYWKDNDRWKKYAETLVGGSFTCLDRKSHRGTRGGRLSCSKTLPPLHTNTQHINKLK